MPFEAEEIFAVIERCQLELGVDLSSWEQRCQAVASQLFEREECFAIVLAALMIGQADFDLAYWKQHVPGLIDDSRSDTPLAGSARDILVRIGAEADQAENERIFN